MKKLLLFCMIGLCGCSEDNKGLSVYEKPEKTGYVNNKTPVPTSITRVKFGNGYLYYGLGWREPVYIPENCAPPNVTSTTEIK